MRQRRADGFPCFAVPESQLSVRPSGEHHAFLERVKRQRIDGDTVITLHPSRQLTGLHFPEERLTIFASGRPVPTILTHGRTQDVARVLLGKELQPFRIPFQSENVTILQTYNSQVASRCDAVGRPLVLKNARLPSAGSCWFSTRVSCPPRDSWCLKRRFAPLRCRESWCRRVLSAQCGRPLRESPGPHATGTRRIADSHYRPSGSFASPVARAHECHVRDFVDVPQRMAQHSAGHTSHKRAERS